MLDSLIARETEELRRRVAAYRGDRPPLDLEGRTVIVVDDGVATGVTDTAALRAVRRRRPARTVLAVPVCAPDSAARLRDEADEVVCLTMPPLLYGVGQWYRDFSQVSDEEVWRRCGRSAVLRRWKPYFSRMAAGEAGRRVDSMNGDAARPAPGPGW